MIRIKRRLFIAVLFLFIFILVLLFESIRQTPQNPVQTPKVTITVIPTTVLGVSSIPGKCRISGVLPDRNCTPGAVDPSVTQDNLFQTICVKGYTSTVRPAVEYTNKLKRQQIADYGYADTNLRNYEEDHLISLELGGAPSDPKNLWPEPGASPNEKDKIENLCHKKICSGQISLKDAQYQISTNWTTACQ